MYDGTDRNPRNPTLRDTVQTCRTYRHKHKTPYRFHIKIKFFVLLYQRIYDIYLSSLFQLSSDGLVYRSTSKKNREIIHRQLADGSLHILVGTHAVIEDNVKFKNLGFVVIDEQHRFGVAQRARMWKKNSIPPHVLVMTATPIPRTLAMTVYGDLSVSVIDELPPGRKPIHKYTVALVGASADSAS